MSLLKIFKSVLIPCAAGVTNATSQTNKCTTPEEEKTKPSDLPIYSNQCNVCEEKKKCDPPPSGIEEAVGNIRKELWVWQDNLRGYRHKIVDVYRKGFSKADFVVDYLREESHAPQRYGAIALSGLAGYILGMRRGRFRRILYTFYGAAAMTAICYPNETLDCVESVVLEARKYFIVAYHFISGETPKMPGWLDKLILDMDLKMNKVDENKTVMMSFAGPVEKPEKVEEEEPKEEKPKGRDCLCSPDPKNPKPCGLKCD